jgi:uncharacterized membrane protein
MNRTKTFLTPEERIAVQDAIGEVEQTTAGEVRVSIRERRSWRERKLSLEDLAMREFQSLGMTKTVGRTGILIFLLLSDRQLYILADEGIHRHVSEKTWREIADRMSALLAAGSNCNGLVEGVRAVGDVLAQFIPPVANDRNELPNNISIR